jgi:hypothetical protein
VGEGAERSEAGEGSLSASAIAETDPSPGFARADDASHRRERETTLSQRGRG